MCRYITKRWYRSGVSQTVFAKAQEWIIAITADKEPFDRDLFVEQ